MSRLESTRLREAFKYEPEVIGNVHRYHDHSLPIPADALQRCEDRALTAFAQLCAIKLEASRVWISVFDDEFQYLIAEATQSSSLDPKAQSFPQLWPGGTILPRRHCICEHVLDVDDSQRACQDGRKAGSVLPLIAISDLTQHPHWHSHVFVSQNPELRFYAGVPIRSPKGIDIGVLCVMDNKPRDTLEEDSTKFMCDLSGIILEHLESKRSGSTARRYIRMVRGLGSFVEGYASSFGWLESDASAFSAKEGAEGDLNAIQQRRQRDTARQANAVSVRNRVRQKPPTGTRKTTNAKNNVSNEVEHTDNDDNHACKAPSQANTEWSKMTEREKTNDNDEDPFLTQVKDIFSRAANIVRESIEVEGVLFLDASVRSFAGLRPHTGNKHRDAGYTDSFPDSSSTDENAKTPDEQNTPGDVCGVFGFSTTLSSSIDTESADQYQINIPERLLKTLSRRYQSGKIFNFNSDGSLVPSHADESPEGILTEKIVRGMSRDLFAKQGLKQERSVSEGSSEGSTLSEGCSIIRIIPGARSIAVVPLWDSQKERWFATALVWTQQPGRAFTMSGEMSYLRAFGTSIMAQVSAINTIMSEKARTDVLGSVSHELRSPLHGIVSAVEMLHGTQLDAFQNDVLHTMECCGRTLLDVIDHLLDYANINSFRRNTKKLPLIEILDKRKVFENSILSRLTDVDLSALAEESVESVYAGYNFQKMSTDPFSAANGGDPSGGSATQHLDSMRDIESLGRTHNNTSQGLHSNIDGVSVYLDMDANVNWRCRAQAGALRRIIMNLFGNSLKYTTKGFIHISLRVKGRSNGLQTLTLTITDSGIGMGDDFLRDKLFQPFSQENSLTLGTGLGLSVVHKIVKMIGGTINVKSRVRAGTVVAVTLPIFPAHSDSKTDEEFAKHVTGLSGLRINLAKVNSNVEITDTIPILSHLGDISERALLETICREWLKMEVIELGNSDMKADLMVCSDFSMEETANEVTMDDICPPTVVICRTTVSAHQRGSSSKPTRQMPTVGFVSRPTGPRKMARALMAALDSYIQSKQLTGSGDTSNEDIPSPQSLPSPFPQTGPTDLKHNSPSSELDLLNENVSTEQRGKMPHSIATQGAFFSATRSDPRISKMRCPTSSNKRYLLVDDNAINLKILTTLIGKLRHLYDTATNGLEALKVFSAEPRRYCCVLIDISMPVMDGLECTRRIRQLERKLSLKPIPIIALTGLASFETQMEAFASGIDIYLTKPVRFKDLSDHLASRGL